MAKKAKKTNNKTSNKFNPINEIVLLFSAVVDGLAFIFLTIPSSIGKILNQKPEAKIKTKDGVKNVSEVVASGQLDSYDFSKSNEGLIKTIADFFQNMYESIPAVQRAKAKYEASLKPIVLNPEIDGVKSATKVLYKYVARNAKGEIVTGYFPAFSRMDVYSYLTDEKMIVYSIITNKSISFFHSEGSAFKSKMKTKDLIFWLAQLSTYIKAGIPLTDSVRVLAQQDKRKKYQSLYQSLIFELTTGQTFSESLARQGSAFPSLLINMIKSSEMTGNVEKTLDEMSDYYQEMEDTKRAIIGAIAYPSVVMVFAIGIVIFMLSYIVPKFVEVYASMGSEINAITQICLDISEFLTTKYMYIIVIIAGIIISYILLYKNVKAFKMEMQKIFMKLPVVGKLIIAKEMNLFSRTFASLQKNNVLLTDSIDILAKITENEIYKDLMMRTINNLIKGNKMSETFANNWAVPEIAYFMIVTGESTGELAEMLDKVADYYQKEERNTVGSIKTFIEPVMIIGLAVVVGFILVAILIPMFDIYSTVS
ncbi:MAG: type II secretion system F family protein [Bacilli bacterium]|nr:type II secretion system F family protein [Bacilli bacterium]